MFYLVQCLLSIKDLTIDPAADNEYIITSNELKMWDQLLDKFQLREPSEITSLEYIGLVKLIEERLSYTKRKAKELYLESIKNKHVNSLYYYIDEEIKLTIIQSKLRP